jgi:hypothetical protein
VGLINNEAVIKLSMGFECSSESVFREPLVDVANVQTCVYHRGVSYWGLPLAFWEEASGSAWNLRMNAPSLINNNESILNPQLILTHILLYGSHQKYSSFSNLYIYASRFFFSSSSRTLSEL